MDENKDLYILWTNDNPITAEKMVFMYGMNSIIRGWWEKVTIIIWGATAHLVTQNTDIQKKVGEAREIGVRFIACKACADQLGVSEDLGKLGITVDYTGALLTNVLKSKEALLTV